jgi:hypothetical protein
MAQSFFLLAQICIMAMIAGGVWIMAKGIVREDFSIFRNSLYWFLASSVMAGFMFALRTGLHFQRASNMVELPLIGMSLALGFISILGISYYYIHTVMPEVFVKAAVFFSVTLLLINVLSVFPPKISKAADKGTKHKFVESSEYQMNKQKENASLASNP